MKVFQEFEKIVSFVIVRDESDDSTSKARAFKSAQAFPIILKRFLVFLTLGYSIFFTGMYLLFEATTFRKFSEAFYPWITDVVNMLLLVIVACNKSQIFEFIKNVGNEIEKSEPKVNIDFRNETKKSIAFLVGELEKNVHCTSFFVERQF